MASERPLRVCTLVQLFPPLYSGMGIQVQRSLPFLQARGVEVTVLTSRLPGNPGSQSPAGDRLIERVLTPGSSRLALLRRTLDLRRFLAKRATTFDVLHSDLLGWEFLFNLPLIKSLSLPTILEMVLLGADDPYTVSRERLGRHKMRLLRSVDLWVGISGAFLPRLTAAGLPRDRFRRVHPGVDVEVYRPPTPDERRALRARLGLPVEARIVLSVGSVMERKGFDRVVKAWAHLRPLPSRDLLLIVGPAGRDEGLEEAHLDFARGIRRDAGAPGLAGTVRLTGQVENAHDYFGAADLFLLLSRQEGLPIVSAEALAAGLPIVISPLDGIEEVVAEGRTGFVVRDPDDAASVASLVSRLLDSPAERALMGRRARDAARASFSFEARADALSALYRELAARRPRSDTLDDLADAEP